MSPLGARRGTPRQCGAFALGRHSHSSRAPQREASQSRLGCRAVRREPAARDRKSALGAAGLGPARNRFVQCGADRAAGARHRVQAAVASGRGAPRPAASAPPAAPVPVDSRSDPCRGGVRGLWRGDLRCRSERLRVLCALASCPNRQGDANFVSQARARNGHTDHGQGHVPHAVIVQKYGGTSVGTAARIRRVSRRIAATVKQGHQVVVVVSAMGHTTDRLIALAESVNPEPPARELDMLVATGETIQTPLGTVALAGMGVPAVSLSGLQAGVRTSAAHSKARIQDIKPDRILEALASGKVVVVAGFQGVTEELEVTTLGRGGSDTTAVALAAVLNAESCEIFTDVDGIFTADPRLVKTARKLAHIQYDEMLELAAVGARVLHPRAVEIGELYGVSIHVRSSFHEGVGTMIVAQVPMEERKRVRGIAEETNVAKITVVGVPDRPGVAAAIFEPLGAAGISVDVIVQNIGRSRRTDLTFSVAESDLKAAEKLVKAAAKSIGAKKVESAAGVAKLSIVGTGMLGTPGIAGRMFRSLAEAGINIEMISTSEIRITCLVARDQVQKGVRALHKTFELDLD